MPPHTSSRRPLRRSAWSGVRVLITAGPTREWIDPVRYLSNAATGALGFALAKAATAAGAHVTLIAGPTHLAPPNVAAMHQVESADDMFAACKKFSRTADVIIMTAAVADVRPVKRAPQKLKKNRNGKFSLKSLPLEPTPDILHFLGEKRKKSQFLVGFCLESDHLITKAQQKMYDKRCNVMVANGIDALQPTPQRVIVLTTHGDLILLPALSKQQLAKRLLLHIAHARANH